MYEYKTRIRYSELDESGRIRLLSLLNYLQDTSCFHGQSCGMSTKHYALIHKAWLLNYWDIYIDRLPTEGQEIFAGTAPHVSKGLFAYRNFWLRDENDYLLRADSSWFLVNTDTMMPIRHTAEDISPYGEIKDYLSLGITTRKVRLPETVEMHFIGSHPVSRDMIDSNHHVNNIRYIAAAYEALISSGAAAPDFFPAHIRAEYKHAAVFGDSLNFYHFQEDNRHLLLVSANDGRACCSLELS